MKRKPTKRSGKCHVCGTALDAGFCWKCGGEGPPTPTPAPIPKEAEPICTPEENRAGLAALKAAIYGKHGPMAELMDRVAKRLSGIVER